jgi:hypothetical protein
MLITLSKIVSFFIIQRPHSMTDNEKAAGAASIEFPPGMNKELAGEFHSISIGLRGRNGFDPARDYSKTTLHFSCAFALSQIEASSKIAY